MTANRIAALASSAVVLVVVLVGLYLSGTPDEQRQLRIDERRVEDLARISTAISAYRERNDLLPEELTELVDGQRVRSLPTDPETHAAYEFNPLGPQEYELCAEFSRASVNDARDDFWAHVAGRQCFQFSARQ